MRAPRLLALLLLAVPLAAVAADKEIRPAVPSGKEGKAVPGDKADKPAPEKEKEKAPPRKKPATGKEAKAEKALENHFLAYDKNRDEKVSLTEFRSGYRGGDLGEAPRLFKERDGDKDEFLDREEFLAIPATKILTKNEQDEIEGRDWKKEREKRERERERERDRDRK